MPILKLTHHDEVQEIRFEIASLAKMTTDQLFQMMIEKSKIIRQLLEQNGHPRPHQIVKRTSG